MFIMDAHISCLHCHWFFGRLAVFTVRPRTLVPLNLCVRAKKCASRTHGLPLTEPLVTVCVFVCRRVSLLVLACGVDGWECERFCVSFYSTPCPEKKQATSFINVTLTKLKINAYFLVNKILNKFCLKN